MADKVPGAAGAYKAKALRRITAEKGSSVLRRVRVNACRTFSGICAFIAACQIANSISV